MAIRRAKDFFQETADGMELRFELQRLEKDSHRFSSKLSRVSRILTQKRRSYYRYLLEEGELDSTRFVRVAVDPTTYDYYKQEIKGDIRETSILFLVDPVYLADGEIRKKLAVSLDMIAKSFDDAGVGAGLYSYSGDVLIEYLSVGRKYLLDRDMPPFLLADLGTPLPQDGFMEAVVLAAKMLIRGYEENKLLFIVSPEKMAYDFQKSLQKKRVSVLQLSLEDADARKSPDFRILKMLAEYFNINIKVFSEDGMS